jgi:hypothetical protein
LHLSQLHFSAGRWSSDAAPEVAARDAQIVMVFGDRFLLASGEYLPGLRERFPTAQIVSCSSGGDILGGKVVDSGLVATAIRFENATVHAVEESVADAADSERAGRSLAARLEQDGLKHVLVFAEGLRINGSSLARGLSAGLPENVSVSGGLAGDGDRFESTLVGLDAAPAPGRIVAIGFYGDALSVGVGSFGGWEPFGEERTITRSEGNVVYELDGRRALDVYKELLGPFGYALPAIGLSFPLSVWQADSQRSLVRTILGVDEKNGSLSFAGDVPQGSTARLLRSNLDQLIVAAGTAAGQIPARSTNGGGRLAVAVSCIGRKLVLQRRVDEELLSVLRTLGPKTHMTGFYSYGELAPTAGFSACELHNQTMTLTVFGEN